MSNDSIMHEASLHLEGLEIEPAPARKLGGQHVGYDSGVKVTHTPSGLVAYANVGRSQHRNLAIAKEMIIGGLTSPSFR